MGRQHVVSEARETSSGSGWQQARRKAFVEDALAAFARRQRDLFDFEQVSRKLSLSTMSDRGLGDVPLDTIVGSVGRYAEFTRAFLPRADSLQERWQRVEQIVAAGQPMPPVDLLKVGGVHFVRDGNHRVSVARQRGWATIKAHIWEFEGSFPLRADLDVDSQLCLAAHAAFVEVTHLDRSCPAADIRLTAPDGYDDLLREIEGYRQVLSRIDEREITPDEATALWYEMRYLPVLDTIHARCALDEFPGRTETDLYLWLCRNLEELEERYGHRVSLAEAADDLAGRSHRWLLPVRFLRKIPLGVKGFVQSRAAAGRRFGRRALQRWRMRRSQPRRE